MLIYFMRGEARGGLTKLKADRAPTWNFKEYIMEKVGCVTQQFCQHGGEYIAFQERSSSINRCVHQSLSHSLTKSFNISFDNGKSWLCNSGILPTRVSHVVGEYIAFKQRSSSMKVCPSTTQSAVTHEVTQKINRFSILTYSSTTWLCKKKCICFSFGTLYFYVCQISVCSFVHLCQCFNLSFCRFPYLAITSFHRTVCACYTNIYAQILDILCLV